MVKPITEIFRPFGGSAEGRFIERENNALAPENPRNGVEFWKALKQRFDPTIFFSRFGYMLGLNIAGDIAAVAGHLVASRFHLSHRGQFFLPIFFDEGGTALLTARNREGGWSAGNYSLDLFEAAIQRTILHQATKSLPQIDFTTLSRSGRFGWRFANIAFIGAVLLVGSAIARTMSHFAFHQNDNPLTKTKYGIALEVVDMMLTAGQSRVRHVAARHIQAKQERKAFVAAAARATAASEPPSPSDRETMTLDDLVRVSRSHPSGLQHLGELSSIGNNDALTKLTTEAMTRPDVASVLLTIVRNPSTEVQPLIARMAFAPFPPGPPDPSALDVVVAFRDAGCASAASILDRFVNRTSIDTQTADELRNTIRLGSGVVGHAAYDRLYALALAQDPAARLVLTDLAKEQIVALATLQGLASDGDVGGWTGLVDVAKTVGAKEQATARMLVGGLDTTRLEAVAANDADALIALGYAATMGNRGAKHFFTTNAHDQMLQNLVIQRGNAGALQCLIDGALTESFMFNSLKEVARDLDNYEDARSAAGFVNLTPLESSLATITDVRQIVDAFAKNGNASAQTLLGGTV